MNEFALRLAWRRRREKQGEDSSGAAPADAGSDVETAAPLFDELARYPQSQPGPGVFLAGKERFKDAFHMLGVNTATGVRHGDAHTAQSAITWAAGQTRTQIASPSLHASRLLASKLESTWRSLPGFPKACCSIFRFKCQQTEKQTSIGCGFQMFPRGRPSAASERARAAYFAILPDCRLAGNGSCVAAGKR